MRVTLTPDALRAIASPNLRPWTAEEVKPHVDALGPWLQVSGVLQMFHAPCIRSQLALRIFVAAAALTIIDKDTAWTEQVQHTVDEHIKAGYIMVERRELMKDEIQADGTLFVELNVLLTPSEAERVSVARFLVPVFPKCAHCHTILKPDLPVPACSQCGLVYYCKEGCEQKHKPWHEKVCGVKKEEK